MDPYLYRLIRFVILLSCLIPSFICYLLVFFFLFKTKQITTQHLHHHFIFALLICNFIFITTELPITLVLSYQGYVSLQSDQFCSFWVVYNYALDVIGLLLTAFGSIERYFLIFHERFVHRWRHVVHYPFIFFCFIYPLIFYGMIVTMYPCENVYYYDVFVCGGACYQYQTILGTSDYLTHMFAPVAVIVLANMILLFRVMKQKRTMKIANTWRKNRLIYIQLVSISILYFISWIPLVIVSLIRLFYDPLFLQDLLTLLLYYCIYIAPLASPFISLVGLPAVRQRLIQTVWSIIGIHRVNDNRIRPIASIITRSRRQNIKSHQQQDEHMF